MKVIFLDIQAEQRNINYIFEIAWSTFTCEQPWSKLLMTESEDLIINHALIQLPVGHRLSKTTQRITGLNHKHFVQAISLDQALEPLIQYFHTIDSDIIYIVSHYASYEKYLLETVLAKRDCAFTLQWICTYQLGKRLFPHLLQHSLHALSAYFNLNLNKLRRGEAHCKATHHIYCSLLGLFYHQGIDTFDALISYQKSSFKKVKKQVALQQEKRLNAPEKIGVYYLFNRLQECLYVGRSKNIRRRLNQHFTGHKQHSSWHTEMIIQAVDLAYEMTPTILASMHTECDEIKKRQPHYNQMLKQIDVPIYLNKLDFRIYGSADELSDLSYRDYIGPWVDLALLDQLASSHAQCDWNQLSSQTFRDQYPMMQDLIAQLDHLDHFQSWMPYLHTGRLIWYDTHQWWYAELESSMIQHSHMITELPIHIVPLDNPREALHQFDLSLILTRLEYDCARMSVKFLQQLSKQYYSCYWQEASVVSDQPNDGLWYQLIFS